MTCHRWMSLPAVWTTTQPSDTTWRLDSGKSCGWVPHRVTACPTFWGLPSSMVMCVIGIESDTQVGPLAICSFYDKTNIVNTVPTCVSDNIPSHPPHARTLVEQ